MWRSAGVLWVVSFYVRMRLGSWQRLAELLPVHLSSVQLLVLVWTGTAAATGQREFGEVGGGG